MNTLSSLLKFIANSIAPIISNQTAKKVLAAPNGATGKPSFRELQASDITSGTLATARIPNLDASKITSGAFDTARIPNIAASKVTSGAFAAARIPNLDASKITSGTLDAARIPTIGVSKVSGALATSNLICHTWELDNKTISDDYDSFTINAGLSGYSLIGVVCVRFTNASKNGDNSTGITLRGFTFNSSNNTITVYARKVISPNAKIKIIATGLYKK